MRQYLDDDDRAATIKAEIDEERRRGKRALLRTLNSATFTVDDIAILLSNGSCYQQRMACHVLSERDEDEYDRMLRSSLAMREQPFGKWPRDLDLSDWERRTGHRRRPCRTHCSDSCSNCNLFICDICGGSEGSLLPYCPERRLPADEDSANYAHYCAGTGPFAKASFDNLTEAKDRCEERMRVFRTPGSEILYHAVWQLWNRTEAGPLPRE